MAIPPLGLGRLLTDAYGWLKDNLAAGDYACHSVAGYACDAAGFYFRRTEDADRFTRAFPDLLLADGTTAATYSRPGGRTADQST